MNRGELLADHLRLVTALNKAHDALGARLGEERDAKVNGYFAASGTDKAREQNGAIAALEITKEVFKLRAEIAHLTEERDHVRLVLAYDSQ